MGGFVIDNRFELQSRVIQFLRQNALGQNNSKSLGDIQTFLVSEGISLPIDQIQIVITVPLKKTGLVGSTHGGHFMIDSADDLIASYCFHLTKVASSHTIMKRYQDSARYFGDLDLEDECGGALLNKLS